MSKLVWARIGMALEVSDEEFEQLKRESTDWYDGKTHEYVLTDAWAERFVKDGTQDGDSFIPEEWIEEPDEYEDE